MIKQKLLALVFFLLSGSSFASTYNVSPNDQQVNFLASGRPSFLKVNGEGAKLTGTVIIDDKTKIAKADLTADLTSLTTGIDTRDKHMKEKYLEVSKYPNAKIVIPTIAEKTGECAFSGSLELHGKTQPVSGKCELTQKSDGAYAVRASFTAPLSDYNIDIPKFAGVTIANDVEVTVNFNLVKDGK